MTTSVRQESTFYTHQLPNGLQMIGQLMSSVQSAAAVYWVDTGARDEPIEQEGVSHFLEHMAFRRTRNMSNEEIDRAFEEMGADHNAATWLDRTWYWARVLSENVPWAVDVLSEIARPVLDAQDFDSERKVILEEIARYEDQPVHVLISSFMRDLFGDHPLCRETLGTRETIGALTVEQMRAYWNRRYGTNNMLFGIAGNFDWDTVVQQVDTLTQAWKPGETGRKLWRADFQPKLHVIETEKFAQEQVAIGAPSVTRADERYYAAAVLSVILGDDTGSRLYWALVEPGIAETATAQVMALEDNGLLLLHVATDPGTAVKALSIAREELERLQGFDVEQGELDRAKAKLNSSIIIGGESTNERVMALIRSWLTYRRLESLEEIRRKVEAVTLDDLRALLERYPIAPDQVITCVGPVPERDFTPAL